MLDTTNSRSADTHDDVWELIPWFVNGSLPVSDIDKIKRHIHNCPDCAAEVARQNGLAQKVMTADPFDPPLARSWSTIQAQIKAEEHNDTPRIDVRRWFAEWQRGIMLAGAGLAACLIAVIIVLPANEDNFRTLTLSSPPLQNTVKFQINSDVSIEQLKELLAEHGLTLVGTPTKTGVYTASASDEVDMKTISEKLMITPEIIFAASAQQP